MLTLNIPADIAARDAAVFSQSGEFVMTGHREECEQRAQAIGGLYCWIDQRTGGPIIRTDFERHPATFTIWWTAADKQSTMDWGTFSSRAEAEAALPAAKQTALSQCGEDFQRAEIEAGSFSIDEDAAD